MENEDLIIRPDGSQTPGYGSWTGDLPGEEWAYVRDATLPRSLYLIHEEDDSLSDTYWQLNNELTILGFGRDDGNTRYLTQVPQHFIFGLVDKTVLGDVEAVVHNAYMPLDITLGLAEALPSGPTATETPTSTSTIAPTATATSTVIPTATSAATATATSTLVATPTAAPTATSAATTTATSTLTPTPTLTNTPVPPTATTPATAIATETPTPTSTPISTSTPTTTPDPTPVAGEAAILLISYGGNGSVGEIDFADEDILAFDLRTNTWSLWFDGSDVGLGDVDVNALALLPDGRFLISVDEPLTISGPGWVDDSDLLIFTPQTLGETTSGGFDIFLDGADFSLGTAAEAIDAATFTNDGDLLISTVGNLRAGNEQAEDDDLVLIPISGDNQPGGDWSLYFDGSDVGLSAGSEDITAAFVDIQDGRILLSTQGNFSVPGLSGTSADIFRCLPGELGSTTTCTYDAYWHGADYGIGDMGIDAVSVMYSNTGNSSTSAPTATNTPVATPTAVNTPTPTTAPSITPTPTSTPLSSPTPVPTSVPTPGPTSTPVSVACPAPRALDQWERHVIDTNRPGQATYMFDVDVNGDNKIDLVTGQFWYENVDGTASGNWVRHTIGAPITDVIAAYDFDGDTDIDFLGTTGSTIYPDGVWAPFAWARNDGNGNLTILTNIDGDLNMPPNDPVQGVAIAHFNPGGPLQIAITWDDTENTNRNDNGIQLLTVPANPSVEPWTREKLSDFSLGEDLVASDLDTDGDIDLFIGKSWLRNEYPSSTWTPIEIFTLPDGYQASRQKLVDIDGDTDLDAVIGYSHSPEKQQVAWYEQGSSPTNAWTEHIILQITTVNPRAFAESLDVADMDGDGDSDVLVGEYRVRYSPPESFPAKLWVVENMNDGATWVPHLVYDGDSHYQSSQAADIDGDGDLDIISKGWLHYRVQIYENKACP
ncbi:MAG: FG-GAP-like repeat-containing protein [Chloroflexota bacterium]